MNIPSRMGGFPFDGRPILENFAGASMHAAISGRGGAGGPSGNSRDCKDGPALVTECGLARA
jgi:hypothetical protein